MRLRLGAWTTLGVLLAIEPAAAQMYNLPRQAQTSTARVPAGPNQPVVPRHPVLQQRGPAPQAQTPFPPLTPQQEEFLTRVLKAWEKRSAEVKTFECKFTRWEYDLVFGDRDKPKNIDQGKINYAAPDQGRFEVEGERAEKWICDGKSVYEYNYPKKQLIQRDLPSELQGKAISEGPLPFLFGAQADKLKRRYFLRLIQPPPGTEGQYWLEAHPRFQADAANFKVAVLSLTIKDMTPFGMRITLPNGKNYSNYRFYDIVINDRWRFIKGNPFRATTPPLELGWKRIVEPAPATQIGQPPGAGVRR